MARFHLDKKFICEFCAYSSSNRGEMNIHVQSVHSKVATEECQFCTKMFKSRRSVKRHIRIVHEQSGEPVNCEICGKTLKSKFRIKNHMKVIFLLIN